MYQNVPFLNHFFALLDFGSRSEERRTKSEGRRTRDKGRTTSDKLDADKSALRPKNLTRSTEHTSKSQNYYPPALHSPKCVGGPFLPIPIIRNEDSFLPKPLNEVPILLRAFLYDLLSLSVPPSVQRIASQSCLGPGLSFQVTNRAFSVSLLHLGS